MRIAICISGLLRSFDKVFPFFYKNLIEPNKHHDIDIFVCTSTYNNHKTRFRIDKEFFLDKKYIENILKEKFKYYLKGHIILDEKKIKNVKHSHKSLFSKVVNVLNLKQKYEKNNNFKYDIVLYTRFDIIFTSWKLSDKYYEDRVLGIPRSNGLLKHNGLPIGVKEHGCVSVQKCPLIEEVDSQIILNKTLKDNEIYCYEDFGMGNVFRDFFYCNSLLSDKIKQFYVNYINKKIINNKDFPKLKFNNSKLNTIQSYDVYYTNKQWYLYDDSKIESIERQFRLFLLKSNINLIYQLRFEKDLSFLIIR